MKKTSKRIGLGSLVLVATVGIPTTIAVSCGKVASPAPKAIDEKKQVNTEKIIQQEYQTQLDKLLAIQEKAYKHLMDCIKRPTGKTVQESIANYDKADMLYQKAENNLEFWKKHGLSLIRQLMRVKK